MAIKLTVPTVKEFQFVLEDTGVLDIKNLRRCREDEKPDAIVTFRQGTMQDDEQRTGWANRRKYAVDQDSGSIVEVADVNPDYLRKLEVYLTLADTDICFSDGKALEFESDGGVKRVKNRAQFERWWGSMRTQWCQEIYLCCVECNPDWNSKRY